MNKRWLLILTFTLAVGGAFALGGATTFAGRSLLARINGDSLVAGVVQQETDQATPTDSTEKGIVVVSVIPDSPAAVAGVQRGDILLSVDANETNNVSDVHTLLADKAEGDSVTLQITRGGVAQTLTATLDEALYLGIETCGFGGSLSLQTFPAMPAIGGSVAIEEVTADSPAADAGLAAGDVITAINGEELTAPMALGDAVAAAAPGDKLTLTVEDENAVAREVEVTLGTHPDDASKAFLGVRYAPLMIHMGMTGIPYSPEMGETGVPSVPGLPTMPTFDLTIPTLGEGEEYGALVVAEVESDSAAAVAGLQAGDHITEIDGRPVADIVESERDINSLFSTYAVGDDVTLTVQRGAAEAPLTLTATLAEGEDGSAVLGIQVGFIYASGDDQLPFGGFALPEMGVPSLDMTVPATLNEQA